MGSGWKLYWNYLESCSAHLLITSIVDAFIGTHFYRCNWICHEVDVAQLGDHNVGWLEWTVECRAQRAIDDENLSCQKILPDGLQFGRWCPEHNGSFSFETWKTENINIEYARWYFFHVYETHRALRRGVRVKSGAQFTTGLFAGWPLGSIVKRNSVSDEKAERERKVHRKFDISIDFKPEASTLTLLAHIKATIDDIRQRQRIIRDEKHSVTTDFGKYYYITKQKRPKLLHRTTINAWQITAKNPLPAGHWERKRFAFGEH